MDMNRIKIHVLKSSPAVTLMNVMDQDLGTIPSHSKNRKIIAQYYKFVISESVLIFFIFSSQFSKLKVKVFKIYFNYLVFKTLK